MPELRVGILLPESSPSFFQLCPWIDRTSGGAFRFSECILLELIKTQEAVKEDLSFIFFGHHSEFQASGNIQKANHIKYPNSIYLFSKALLQYAEQYIKFLWSKKTPKFQQSIDSVWTEFFRSQGVTLIYSPFPIKRSLRLPYITTIWDVSHRVVDFCPEFTNSGMWEEIETTYCKTLPRASMVIVGTEYLKSTILQLYSVLSNKIRVIHFPNPIVFPLEKRQKPNKSKQNLDVIFPSRLWPHKNHKILFEAFKLLKFSNESRIRLTLCGLNQSETVVAKRIVKSLGLEDLILCEGYLSDAALLEKYMECDVVVYPSLAGPDNLPPLEGLEAGKTVLVADIPGARECYSTSVLYFDPFDANALAKQLKIIFQKFQDDADNSDLDQPVRVQTSEEYCRTLVSIFKRCAEENPNLELKF